MNEKLCEQILEYMKGTGDFILKEMPDVIQQALTYYWISSLTGLIFYSIIFIILISYLLYTITHLKYDTYGGLSTFSFGSILITGFISFIFFIGICSSSDKLIKISYAPKYFIISLFTEK